VPTRNASAKSKVRRRSAQARSAPRRRVPAKRAPTRSVLAKSVPTRSVLARPSVPTRREATSKSAPTKKGLRSSTERETLALFGRMSTTTSVVALCGNIHTAGQEGKTSASIVCTDVVVDSTHPRSNSHQAAGRCSSGMRTIAGMGTVTT